MSDVKQGVMSPFAYDEDDDTKQRMLLLGLFVAGKNAGVQEVKLDRFLANLKEQAPAAGMTHFDRLACVHNSPRKVGLTASLLAVKSGQYLRLFNALASIVELTGDIPGWWLTLDRDELCASVKGLGMKTASFYLQFTRRGQRVACLDTHILAYMRENGIGTDVPSATPTLRRKYLALEEAFLRHCDSLSREPAELDFEIWLKRSVTAKAHGRREKN